MGTGQGDERMDLRLEKESKDGLLTLRLAGRLDSSASPILESELSRQDAENLILDFDMCTYVSSAGLRVLMVAYRRQVENGGSMLLVNVTENIQRVLEITGLNQLLAWKPKIREISLDQASLISAGACGECYQLDRETIVKLYGEGVDPSIAEKEKEFAKAAFILGVPTAISYDVVSCGNRTGVVYEMLDAELFSCIIKKDPTNLSKYARKLSDIAKQIHGLPGDSKIFPDMKERFRVYIKQMGLFLTSDEVSLLQQKLEMMPESDRCVHFDLHTSNVMVRKNDHIIIDMGDFSIGTYFFDIGLVGTIYGVPELKLCEKATGIAEGDGLQFYRHFIDAYFSDRSADEYRFVQRNFYFLASLRAIYTITFLPKMREELSSALKNFLLPKIRAKS